MKTRHAAEIRKGITDAKAFVTKARGISKGYVFFESSTATLHGRAFQHALRRISTRGLSHYRRRTDYTDGTTKYVHRIYATTPAYMNPDWYRA